MTMETDTVIERLTRDVKRLLIDQDLFPEDRPRYDTDYGPRDKINRYDKGRREGRIQSLLEAIMIIENPLVMLGNGYDHERENLRLVLLLEARKENQS